MAAASSSAGSVGPSDDEAFRKQFMIQLNQTLVNMDAITPQEQPVLVRSMIQEFARYQLGTRAAVPIAQATAPTVPTQVPVLAPVGAASPVGPVGSPEPPSSAIASSDMASLASQLTIEQLAQLIADQQANDADADEDADNE